MITREQVQATIESLEDIKDSINEKEYNVAKIRINILSLALERSISKIYCDDCGAEHPDLCIHERK